MKSENFSIALVASTGSGASRSATSLATGAAWHAASSSRSDWKSSLEMPISTLYASPEKISSDLFCAFQPKRAIVPSLPLRLTVVLLPIGTRETRP